MRTSRQEKLSSLSTHWQAAAGSEERIRLTRGDLLSLEKSGGVVTICHTCSVYSPRTSLILPMCVNQRCQVELLAPSAVSLSIYTDALATCRYREALLCQCTVHQGSTFTEFRTGTLVQSDFNVVPTPALSPSSNAIVRYLDYVDRRIRRYVGAKRKLIALAGGGEAGHRQPGRHPRPGSQRSPQALRRRVARRRAGALGDCPVRNLGGH